MTYQESLDLLYEQLPIYQNIGTQAYKKDLNNTKLLLAALDNPERHVRCLHIAGTNGKGSSAAMLHSILMAAGYRTGSYTSPHLKSFRERIKINQEEIEEASVSDFVAMIIPELDRIRPSFFELTVAMAFWYFRARQVDIAVIETGLGGRLDSTNVIIPEVALITRIGMDHMDILGDTITAIAREKAGIIKPGIPTVLGSHQPEIRSVFEQKAAAEHSELINERAAYHWNRLGETGPGKQTIDLYKHGQLMYARLELNTAADYVLDNLPGVLETLFQLKNKYGLVTERSIRQGLAQFQLKGRVQVLSQEPLVIADISHNEQGMQALLQQVSAWPVKKLRIIMGVVRGKALSSVLNLLPQDAQYYFTQSQVPRALPVSELKVAALEAGLRGPAFANVNVALTEAKAQSEEDDCILICGSTFVVAEIDNL